jgi:PEP-CTERM motif-containing protein
MSVQPQPRVMPRQSKTAQKSSTARRLVQAAALAAVLVPLGSVAIEGSTIYCDSNGSGGCSGTFTSTNTTNTWKFTDSIDGLLYTFTLTGQVLNTFSIVVDDFITTQSQITGLLGSFPNAVCVPTRDPGLCGLFTVSGNDGFVGGIYDLSISWFGNADPLSVPQDAFVLQARNSGGGVFTNTLFNPFYDPQPVPNDPVVGGRGDAFSTFGVFTDSTVPEPASLLLLGSGLGALLYKRGRRKSPGSPPVA